MAECPGHFGHIELSRAVFHVGKSFVVLCLWFSNIEADCSTPVSRFLEQGQEDHGMYLRSLR
jgi:hypothetical protein